MAAFARALELGADGVELDIHATADGAIVVHHDAVLPGLGRIDALPASTVRAYRLANGEPVPLLSEVLALVGTHDVWVEIKTLPQASDATLLDLLAAGPAPTRYAVHAFDHRIIRRLGERAPALRRGALLASYLLDTVAVLRACGAGVLWQEASLIDADLVTELHAADAEIIGWTVDAPKDIARLTALGVDGLCGNYPDRLHPSSNGPAG